MPGSDTGGPKLNFRNGSVNRTPKRPRLKAVVDPELPLDVLYHPIYIGETSIICSFSKPDSPASLKAMTDGLVRPEGHSVLALPSAAIEWLISGC